MCDAEQLERRVDFLIRDLDELVAIAANPETAHLVVAERIGIGQALTRAQLLASYTNILRIVANG